MEHDEGTGRAGVLLPHCSDGTGSATGTSTVVEERTELDAPHTVVVWDDPVNLMNYVVMVFAQVFPDWPREQCEQRMLEVHHQGRSSVFTGPRAEAEVIAQKIQSFQLWVTVEQ